MFLNEKTLRYLKNDYQCFDTSKTKDCRIRRNCNLLIKVKFHELEWSSPLILNKKLIFLDLPCMLFNIMKSKHMCREPQYDVTVYLKSRESVVHENMKQTHTKKQSK